MKPIETKPTGTPERTRMEIASGWELAKQQQAASLPQTIGTIAHDLRSQLNTVSGFCDLLANRISRDGQPNLGHGIERIQFSAMQMEHIIDGMVAIGAVMSHALQLESVNPGQMAREILSARSDRENETSVKITVAETQTIQGDGHLIRRLLELLLDNAWKFSSGEADAQITFGQQQAEPGTMVYFVADNGIGFPPGNATQRIGSFLHARSADDFAYAGNGLAIARAIVSRWGGALWAQDEPGHGAALYFTLHAH